VPGYFEALPAHRTLTLSPPVKVLNATVSYLLVVTRKQVAGVLSDDARPTSV